MNGRQVSMGVLLALGGSALVVIAGGAILGADDLAALPVLVLGGGLVLMGMLLARAGARASAPRSVVRRGHGGTFGHIPGPTGDYGASYNYGASYDDDRHHGGTADPGGWSSGGDSGGGWSFGGGDSGGSSSGGGGGDSGGGGGSS